MMSSGIHLASLAGARFRGYLWASSAKLSPGIRMGSGVRAIGWPSVRRATGATIEIGDSVTLNSWRRGYHAAMHSGVTLIADVPGANISIGEGSRVNGATIHAQANVVLGRRVLVAAQATILDSNAHALWPARERTFTRDSPRAVIIEDDVWIGLGAVVLPGTHVGAGSVIGANAVARGRIEPGSVIK